MCRPPWKTRPVVAVSACEQMNERRYVDPLMSPDVGVFSEPVNVEDWAGRWSDVYQQEELSTGGDGLSLLMAGDLQLFQSDDGLEDYPSDPLREVDPRANPGRMETSPALLRLRSHQIETSAVTQASGGTRCCRRKTERYCNQFDG
ncbi:hypothetical protein PCANC_14368 [Puccinia coronata f. sp. avenae]|uniref:Uncharacterized protein n=1 Tax=Puccinia coronata f. sp. avenae TaxID=200324 RepID=A0A2N5V9G2_9BASI|nr:hypothetical protein PCANC_14368 [Puccinia coronata f. sp. avenae]